MRCSVPTLLLFSVCFSLPAGLASAQGARLYFPQDPELEFAVYERLASGKVLQSSVFPVSGHELYANILESPLPVAEDFRSRLVASYHPSYVSYNTPFSSLGGGGVRTGVQSYYYDAIPPLLELGGTFAAGDSLYGRVQIDSSPSRPAFSGQGSYTPLQPGNYLNLDFPRIGYASVATPHSTLAVGRMKTGFGRGHFGSTMLNGRANYYDQLQFSFWGKGFKYFFMLASSSGLLSEDEAAVQQSSINWNSISDHDGLSPFDDGIKVFAYHRVEVARKYFTLGFSELDVVGGRVPSLSQVGPFNFWHNAYEAGNSNVMFGLDVSTVPIKGLEVFAEILSDDIRASQEEVGGLGTEAVDSVPTSLAWQLGGRYVLPFTRSPLPGAWRYAVGGEYTHVDTWTYGRWQPLLSMYQRQISPGGYPGSAVDIPIGFAYGGDCDHVGFFATALAQSGLRLELSFERLDKGPIYIGTLGSGTYEGQPIVAPVYYDYDKYAGQGALQAILDRPHELRYTTGVALHVPVWRKISVDGHFYHASFRNFNHVAGEEARMLIYHLGARWVF